ncbi:hypothetical protein [Rhodococcus qingshengii]|uniref:hypothetical protein n=1 Tax=Rhodococcus qingshengii TaxID=334542 RepID=UPI0022B2F7E2|nr:hypothetical protein [Rhodococcus qingshengii]MCZ4618411.1 hypothetical protein [Rhodococcus qingshengii]
MNSLFKVSTDPELGARHRRPVLASTDNAIVLCVYEEVADSGPGPDRANAVDADRLARAAHPRLRPTRHLHPGGYLAGRSRWGVAALDIATGRVTGLRKPRHRRQEFLLFLKHLARACPERELYRVRDNYATHKKAEIWCGWPKIFISGAFRAHLGIMNEPGGDVVGIIERQAIHLGPAAPSRS